MSTSNEYLCLEVWLGPMEGVRAVGEGPAAITKGAPQILRIAKLEIDRKDQVRNQLALGACVGVSNDRHAQVRYAQGKIFLRDRSSRNGTFALGEQIPAEEDVVLRSGDIFLVSLTAIRVSLEEVPILPSHPLQPVPVERFTNPDLAPLLSSCRQIAENRRERYIDSRHLAEAMFRMGGNAVEEALSGLGLTTELILNQLWDPTFFPFETAWAAEALLRPLGLAGELGDVFVASPKVCRFLATIRRPVDVAPARDKARILGAELLSALVKDEAGPVGIWLRRLGFQPAPETALPVSAPEGLNSTSSAPVDLPPLVDRTSPSQVFRSLVAPTQMLESKSAVTEIPSKDLEARAHRIAEDVCCFALSHWFLPSQDRKRLLKERITSALETVPKSQYRTFLSALYSYFPVTGPDSESEREIQALTEEVRDLEKRIQELKKKLGDTVKKPQVSIPWQEVTGNALKPTADRDLLLARQVVRFSLDIELFLRELVHGTMNSIYQTGTTLLPDQNTTLRALMDLAVQGRLTTADRVSDYILAVRRWQEACMTAYSEAPSEWFTLLWKKINPAAIEGFVKAGGFKSKEKEWWQEYRSAVKDLGPDLVQDQVLQLTSKLARELYDKLKAEGGPS